MYAADGGRWTHPGRRQPGRVIRSTVISQQGSGALSGPFRPIPDLRSPLPLQRCERLRRQGEGPGRIVLAVDGEVSGQKGR